MIDCLETGGRFYRLGAGGRFYRLLVFTKPDGTVFTFDEDGRAKKETYSNGLVRDFTYTSNQTVISGSNGINITYNLNAFGEVAEYKLQNGENDKNYSYTYDSDGNITTISLNGSLQQTFTYNSSNELVRVDDAVINKTVTYDYDYVGNITSVKTYIYTTGTLGTPITTQNYTYNSQNQRTDLSYDLDGNMTALNGYNFTWDGRKLSSVVNEDTNISYTYNHNGIRTSKTVNGVTTYYEVDENNNVVKQYELVNDEETNVVEFVYDSNGSPIYFTYNNAIYYYEKNLQGDIVGILDANGNTVVEYAYNIWGELVSITGSLADNLGTINPLRYRGYYYDTETNLYYLQSRYYSPNLMRFISQDDPVFSNAQGEPLGSNLYAYCLNNPVSYSDTDGYVRKRIKTTWLSIAADIALAIFCPYVVGVYDVWGWSLKLLYKKVGLTKVANRVLTWLFPKVRGLFSKAWKFLDKVARRILGTGKSIFEGWAIDSLLNKFSKVFKGKSSEIYCFVTSLFSTGSFVVGIFDYITDLKYDGYVTVKY